jgi:peptidyl-prolyl cis-trans isomerase A (cyclophilin A)
MINSWQQIRYGVGVALMAMATGCGGTSDAPAGREAVAPAKAAAPPAAAPIPAPAATPTRSPATFRVQFETTAGPFTVAVTRSLAPHGADRFYELVTIGYFTDVRFFRMVPGFVAQFGIHGDPAVNAVWNVAMIPDDPMRTSNTRGTVAFASSGPNTRATQLFVSTGDNTRKLDRQRVFAPIGRVVDGMDVVDKLNSEYGEEPNHSRAVGQGNAYLEKWFPALDYIRSAKVLPGT